MLIRFRMIFVVFAISLLSATSSLRCLGQDSVKASHRASSLRKPPISASISETKASLEVLARLRALRDCWRDPYMLVQSADPRLENDSLYLRCGNQYQLRLDELQEAAGLAEIKVRDRSMSRQIDAAMEVFNDLDTLRHLLTAAPTF